MTKISRYPLTAHTIARPIPVFPLVGSTTAEPGLSSPLSSASFTICKAMRSFILPPGLNDSTFAAIVAPVLGESLFNFNIGVIPISSRIELLILLLLLFILQNLSI